MNIEIIKGLLEKYPLKSEDKNFLFSLLTQANDEQLKEFFDLIEENPDLIEELVEIYRLKQQAITNKDTSLWKKIVEREINLIDKE